MIYGHYLSGLFRITRLAITILFKTFSVFILALFTFVESRSRSIISHDSCPDFTKRSFIVIQFQFPIFHDFSTSKLSYSLIYILTVFFIQVNMVFELTLADCSSFFSYPVWLLFLTRVSVQKWTNTNARIWFKIREFCFIIL